MAQRLRTLIAAAFIAAPAVHAADFSARPIRIVVGFTPGGQPDITARLIIPFKGIPEALADTMAGRTHFFMAPLASSIGLVREGRLRALGIASEKRLRAHPDIPTIAEAAALPGFRWDSWAGIIAPAKTPRAIVDRLNAEMTRALKAPDVQQKLLATGAEPTPSTPAEFDALIAEHLVIAAKLARAAGIKPE